MKQIHIVHILPTLDFGGAERYVVDLVNNSSPDIRYTIIVFFNQIPLVKEINSSHVQVRVVHKNGKWGIGLVRNLRKVLRELRPNVVHTHLFAGDFWGRIAAYSLKIPVVTTEHNINESEGWFKNFLRYILRNYSDYYVACSKRVKEYAIKRYHLTKPCRVIYGTVDMKRFKNIAPVTLHVPWRLAIVGRLTTQKGHEWALRALAALKKYQWNLEIVGNGELKSKLENLVVTLGLKDRVVFKPAILQIEEVFQHTDVILVPSLWEGLGLVVLEAMAAARIVVASRVDGIKEIITDKKTGFFIETKNGASLQKVLIDIFKNQNNVTQLGSVAREHVRNNFNATVMARQYENVYQDLVVKKN